MIAEDSNAVNLNMHPEDPDSKEQSCFEECVLLLGNVDDNIDSETSLNEIELNVFKSTDNQLSEIELSKKKYEIEKFLSGNHSSEDPKYLSRLRSFALSRGGLVNDDIRKRVWPLLLELHLDELEPYPEDVEFSHVEYSQVVLDVNRSIKRFPPAIPSDQRVSMQDQLIRLILRVITKHPQLQYYQGYHDVAITFLLVVGEVMAFHIMEKLSTNHLKHFMEPTMERTAELLDYIFPLLDHLHPELCDYIEQSEVGSMFCLPWFLTWYSHTLGHYEHVVRLYDYFLASEPLIPLYLIPQIVIYRQDVIFQTECEMSSLHQQLSELPEDLPFDDLLVKATDLYFEYPPDNIEKECVIRRIKTKAVQEERMRKQVRLRKQYTSNRKENPERWNIMNRMFPAWAIWPGRIGFFLFSASFIVGLYVYCRYTSTYDIIHNQQNIASK